MWSSSERKLLAENKEILSSLYKEPPSLFRYFKKKIIIFKLKRKITKFVEAQRLDKQLMVDNGIMYLHLVGHVRGVYITHTKQLKTIMDSIAEKCKFTVVAQAFHQFEPIGTTGVLVLAESHFSCHTYPEKLRVYIDVFCCSPFFNPDECAIIIEQEFGGICEWSTITR